MVVVWCVLIFSYVVLLYFVVKYFMFKEVIVYEIYYVYRKCNEMMKMLVCNFNFWIVIIIFWVDVCVDVFGVVVGFYEKF